MESRIAHGSTIAVGKSSFVRHAGFGSIAGHSYQIGIFLAVPLLLFYKGRQGKKSNVMKWGFYAFYPFHLLLLELVKMIVSA